MKQSSVRPAQLAGALAAVIFLIAFDQITKLLAVSKLVGHPKILIPGVFELRYLENRGAAFGIFRDRQWIFIVFALLCIVFGTYFYFKNAPRGPHFLPLRLICIVLCAGAAGNMIDRIVRGYVVDFLYFSLIDFPVFNVADIYVCVSAFALILCFAFVYTDEDFDKMIGKGEQH